MSPKSSEPPKDFKKRPATARNTKAMPVCFESKRGEERIFKRSPDWDTIQGEPIIELMRVCREFRNADEDWLNKREIYKTRKEDQDRQWEELREKEKQLRLNFIRFDTFIKDNRHKRQRAEIKIKDQKEIQKIREAEILELKNALEHMEIIRSRMQACVEEYQPFKNYLERVVEDSEFSSISAIFNRYETLIDVKKSLHRKQTEDLRLMETTTAQMQKMTEEKSQSLMDLNSRLALLQSRRGHAKNETLHWEQMVSRIKELSGYKEAAESMIRGCMWNLYKQICKRRGIPTDAKRENLEEQLLVIKRTIIQLGKIVIETKRRAAREKKTPNPKPRGGGTDADNSPIRQNNTKSSFIESL